MAVKLHVFNFMPNGIVRVLWHLAAGYRLCGRRIGLLWKLIPDCINSMTAANNFSCLIRDMPPPKTLIDVGANASQMARLLQLALPNSLEVLSFEPNPALKPIGTVFHCALGDRDEMRTFYVPGDTTWGTLRKAHPPGWKVETLNVSVRRFDSLLASGEISGRDLERPILLKVDTEGCEFQTLNGFGDFLQEIDYLLVEIANPKQSQSESDPVDVYGFLAAKGFNASRIVYAGHDGSSLPDYTDVFFWRQSAAR